MALDDTALRLTFMHWAAEYTRSFATIDEFNERFAIFSQNLQDITEHNQGGQAPFRMDLNAFSDLREEEFLSLSKARTKRLKSSTLTPIKPDAGGVSGNDQIDEFEVGALPAYKNWYEEGFVTRPLEQ